MAARVIKDCHGSWFLVEGLAIASPNFRTRADADQWLRRQQAGSKWPRKMPCMCCQTEFESEHKGNRLCLRCRRAPVDALGEAQRPYISRKANGK